MASALFSSRSSSPERGLPCGCPKLANAANRNKTNTFCLVLGLIFDSPTRFFRPLDKEIDPAFDVRVLVPVEMQFRDMPELEAGGQLAAQKTLGVLESSQGL